MGAQKWPRDDYLQALWDCPNLKPNERLVAQAYARFAKDATEAWVVAAEMTRRTGITSRNGIWRATNGLADKGWLVLLKAGSKHRSAIYRIAIPPDCPDDEHTSLCTQEGHKDSGSLVSSKRTQALVSSSGTGLVSSSGTRLVSSRGTPSLQNHSTDLGAGRPAKQGPPPVAEVLADAPQPSDPRIAGAVVRLLRAKERGEVARARARQELGADATEGAVLIRAGQILAGVAS